MRCVRKDNTCQRILKKNKYVVSIAHARKRGGKWEKLYKSRGLVGGS